MKKLSMTTLPPWTWSFVAAGIVFGLTVMVSGGSGMQTLTLALTVAPYLVLVGLGQMLVMSTGPGNIDVSVAKVFSLGGLLSVAVTEATGSWVLGLSAAVASGLALATISVIGILLIRIPPIVATLATSLIASALSLTLAKGFQGSADPVLNSFLNFAPFGVPAFAVAVLILTIFMSFVLTSTTWGDAHAGLWSGGARGGICGHQVAEHHRGRLSELRRACRSCGGVTRGVFGAQCRIGQ